VGKGVGSVKKFLGGENPPVRGVDKSLAYNGWLHERHLNSSDT